MPLYKGLSKREPTRSPRSLTVLLVLVLLVLSAGCLGKETSGPAQTRGSATNSSQARQESEPRFRFIVCGDPQNDYPVFDKVLAAARSVDFLIIAGDMTGSGTPTEFQNFLSKMKGSGVKYYCVPGNHDVASGSVDRVYSAYLGPPRQAFDYKSCHFILIDNSTQSLGFYPQEQQWVAQDLKSIRGKGFYHVFAICHVPPDLPYSSHYDPSERIGMEANENLVPVLSAGNVEELFCGHLHDYEQSKEDGLTLTITGGAGAPLQLGPQSGGYYHYVLVEINGKRRSQRVVKI
jgi:Icc-related predicted phosphoesterase